MSLNNETKLTLFYFNKLFNFNLRPPLKKKASKTHLVKDTRSENGWLVGSFIGFYVM